jgi:RHS repeat-associated protein
VTVISATEASSQLYYLADGLASTTGLTDGEANLVGTYTYDVFGATRSETGGQANDYRFTGQQLDVASGLYYLRARYYDPSIGRFPTRDSFRGWFASPQSQNPYAYALDNPTNLIDPYGLLSLKDMKKGFKKVAEATGGFLSSPWGAPVLCNPMTGPLGCTAAAWLNRDIIGEAWPYISTGVQLADLLPIWGSIPFVDIALTPVGVALDVAAFGFGTYDVWSSSCPTKKKGAMTFFSALNLGVGVAGQGLAAMSSPSIIVPPIISGLTSSVEATLYTSNELAMSRCDKE